MNLATITILERDNDDLMGDLMSFDPGTYGLVRQAEGATLTTEWREVCVSHLAFNDGSSERCHFASGIEEAGNLRVARCRWAKTSVLLVRGAAE